MIRDEITDEGINIALSAVEASVDRRLIQKGRGAFVGPHESYGIIAEEFNKELLDALHSNNSINFYRELVDIAVACVLAMASNLSSDTTTKGKKGD